MKVKKKQFLVYLEIDRNESPEKIEKIIRESFGGKYRPRIRTLITAINYKNLKAIVSQPMVLSEREMHDKPR